MKNYDNIAITLMWPMIPECKSPFSFKRDSIYIQALVLYEADSSSILGTSSNARSNL